MPGRFYTYITIKDVAHKETGRKAALRKFVFLHDLLWINLGNGKKFTDRPWITNAEYYIFNDDVDEFVKTLNLRIVDENPKIVERYEGYHLDVDYVIEQL